MSQPLPDHSKPGAGLPAARAQDFAAVRDWPGYFRAVLGKPPRETLTSALDRFEAEGAPDTPRLAIDLGCGEGRDTLELLRRGWRVLAIDGHADAFDHLLPRVKPADRPRLETRVARFDEAQWPPADLVNASFALPFCDPSHFDTVWRRIVRSLRPGGRFAGQLFGDRDSWAVLPDRSHQTAARVRELLGGLDTELLREEEKDDSDALGNPKHWHVFHIVARKR